MLQKDSLERKKNFKKKIHLMSSRKNGGDLVTA